MDDHMLTPGTLSAVSDNFAYSARFPSSHPCIAPFSLAAACFTHRKTVLHIHQLVMAPVVKKPAHPWLKNWSTDSGVDGKDYHEKGASHAAGDTANHILLSSSVVIFMIVLVL